MMPRIFAQIARFSAAVLMAAVVGAPQVTFAGDGRPYDAPRIQPAPAPAPTAPRAKPRPPQYQLEDGSWIDIVYEPSTRERVRPLIAQAERFREELVQTLKPRADILKRVEVRVAAVPDQMPALGPIETAFGTSEKPLGHSAAWSVIQLAPAEEKGELGGLVVLSVASSSSLDPPDLSAGLRHALAHIALDEALAEHEVPAWFHEGYATHSARADSAFRIQALALASLQKRLLGMQELASSFKESAPPSPLAVAQAADFVRFLMTQGNRNQFAALVQRVRDGEGFEDALNHAYGSDLATLALAWHKDMARRYSFVPILMGTMLTWALIAVAIVVRRMRRRRARRPLLSRHARVRESQAIPRLAPVSLVGPGRRGVREELDRIDLLDEPIPPDAEVPKVEHDGRWHTLH